VKKRDERGITLIELLIVLTILGILMGVIVPRVMDRPAQARQTKAALQIEALAGALKLYQLDNGRFPTTEQGLEALVEAPEVEPLAPDWREGGYLEKGRLPLDPWGQEFKYLSPGVHNHDFDLWSTGADSEEGGEDDDADITNWAVETG